MGKVLSFLGKGVAGISFLTIFLIFVDEISVIPYFFGLLTSFISVFFSTFCYIGVSANAIAIADTLVSGIFYAYLIFYIYNILK